MASSITTVEKVGHGAYRYTVSGTADYRYYSPDIDVDNNARSDTSIIAEWDLPARMDIDSAPIIEVIDSTEDTDDIASVRHPPRACLQWREDPDAAGYLVERYVDAAWVEQANIGVAAARPGYLCFNTLPLPDGVSESWRVRSFDSEGNESPTALTFTIEMVRHRSEPKTDASYSAGTLTITAETA